MMTNKTNKHFRCFILRVTKRPYIHQHTGINVDGILAA